LSTKTKQQQIEWRRDRVLELSSQGFSQSDIATMLQVAKSIISKDMARLRHEAQENLQHHIHETIPEEYQKAMTGINQVLRMCWTIVSKIEDEKTKLQALALINDCNKYKIDLSTNGVVVTDAIKYVNAKMDHLNNQEKKLLQDIKDKRIEDTEAETETEAEAEDTGEVNSSPGLEEQQTHNGIF
jgi:predicted transcriptional regulator